MVPPPCCACLRSGYGLNRLPRLWISDHLTPSPATLLLPVHSVDCVLRASRSKASLKILPEFHSPDADANDCYCEGLLNLSTSNLYKFSLHWQFGGVSAEGVGHPGMSKQRRGFSESCYGRIFCQCDCRFWRCKDAAVLPISVSIDSFKI